MRHLDYLDPDLHEFEADTYQGAVSVRAYSAAQALRLLEDMGHDVIAIGNHVSDWEGDLYE